jgi:hypothetical protein
MATWHTGINNTIVPYQVPQKIKYKSKYTICLDHTLSPAGNAIPYHYTLPDNEDLIQFDYDTSVIRLKNPKLGFYNKLKILDFQVVLSEKCFIIPHDIQDHVPKFNPISFVLYHEGEENGNNYIKTSNIRSLNSDDGRMYKSTTDDDGIKYILNKNLANEGNSWINLPIRFYFKVNDESHNSGLFDYIIPIDALNEIYMKPYYLKYNTNDNPPLTKINSWIDQIQLTVEWIQDKSTILGYNTY